MLSALDFIFYEEKPGTYSGLVTGRTPALFNGIAVPALQRLFQSVDDGPSIVTDTLSEALNEDFFLWLIERDEGQSDVGGGLHINCINEISSKDRLYRSARFKDTANAERIELAALIARGKTGFGPAKLEISSELLQATFDVEFHLDGGFQVLRSSEYEEEEYPAELFGKKLLDDVWTAVLPQFRSAYKADKAWDKGRRRKLREDALDTICEQLKLVRAS